MNALLKHSILFFFLSLSMVMAQQQGYRIEGDEVVFTFNRQDYEKVTHEGWQEPVNFDGLDIYNVVVAGEFNDWSKHQWEMQKVDANTYELRKKLANFTHEYRWEFKYVINNQYWVEPPYEEQSLLSLIKNKYKIAPQNLILFLAYPSDDGNTTFKLKGYSNAEKVILSGSFNKWSERHFKMQKKGDFWELKMNLPPGKYEYKYIVDGEWITDNTHSKKELNEFGGFNSVVDVKKAVTFQLNSSLQAQKVFLAGSFNNWSETELLMEMKDSIWQKTLLLSGGKHHYKFIVDGKWIVDPANSVREYDENGYINSVCMVK